MTSQATLRARWQALAGRERRMVAVAAALVVLVLVWWLLLAPALRTLSASGANHARLDAQLQQMTTLALQAKALQAQPRTSREDALLALEASVQQRLGATAQLQGAGAGEGARVTLRGVPPDTLAQWLAQARGNARAVPREMHLIRAQASAPAATPATGGGDAKSPATGPRWDGTLVMSLPAK